MSMTKEKTGFLSSAKFKWAITLILTIVLLLIPTSEAFTLQMKLFFAVTVFIILILAFELTPMIIPAVSLPILYVVFGLAPGDVVFQPWTTQIPSLLLGAFIITNVMQDTGLSKRIAYWALLKTGGSYLGLFVGSILGGVILGLIVPGAVGRTVLFATIMLGICKALKYESGSKEATGLMFLAFIASNTITHCIFTSNSANLMLAGYLQPYGVEINFVNWMKVTLIPTLAIALGSLFLIWLLYRGKNNTTSKEYLKEEYAKLGKTTSEEKRLAVIAVITVIGFMTVSLHGIQPGFILAIAGVLCFIPQFNLAKKEDIKKINFIMIFLTVGMISIGNVSTHIGAGSFIADIIHNVMPENIQTASLLIYLVVFLGNILLTPLALLSGLLTPLLELGINMGWSPTGMGFLFGSCIDNIILPHETTTALIIFSFGIIKMKDFIKYFALRSILFIPILLVVVIPWFKFIGIL